MRNIFYNDLETVIATAGKGILIYIILIAFLRVMGKRSLSKLNIFDFIITIAIGSVFASTLTSQEVKLAQGTTAIIVLLGGQYLISKLAFKSDKFEKLIKADPALLYYHGKYLLDTMENERVTKREVLQAVRKSGASSMAEVRAVILETDGTISVLSSDSDAPDGQTNELYDSVKLNPEDDLI